MNKYEQLYQTSISFKIYVDKYCEKHNIPKEDAFQHTIIKAYGDYVIKENVDGKTNNAG